MRDQRPWPIFMLGFLLGLIVGVVLSDALGHAQSYVPNEGGQWRQPNRYDSGGMTPTPQGPVYDYGVPKYQPIPPSSSVPWWYGFGMGERRKEAQLKAEVEAMTARLKAQTQATCAEVVRLQQFLEALGVEPTPGNGGCDGVE